MTGRGKPRKDKGPDTKCDKTKTRPEEIKQVSLPTNPGKQFTEEGQNGTTKEKKPKEQKKTNNEEKLSAQTTQKEMTTNPFPAKINKQQRKDTDDKKAPVQGTKVKSCAGRVKTTEHSAEEVVKTETPEDTNQDCPGRAKSTEKFTDGLTKMPENTRKDTACAAQDRNEDKAAVLYRTLKKLKIRKSKRSDAAGAVNKIMNTIIAHLKQKTESFKEANQLRTGSYYENLKISNPDEFDVMIVIPVERVNIKPFGDDGAFYSVALKRGNSPLQRFQEEDTLSASKMLEKFREEVKKSVKECSEWEVTRKKKGCPAVTLINTGQSYTISLDVVLSLMVQSSWPPFTKEGFKIKDWLGTKVREEYKRQPYYLVPKYEGWGTVVKDGVHAKDTWRVSFSHIEKAIMRSHGSEKTCCEECGARCCRKDCLKLLKHLLGLLKESNSSFDEFCSYHAKTTLLHACCSRNKDTEWSASSLGHCFQLLLKDFQGHLESGVLNNFFIPSQNLFSSLKRAKCKQLAQRIKDECDKGFPIFKLELACDSI